jgi:hypothetical protein
VPADHREMLARLLLSSSLLPLVVAAQDPSDAPDKVPSDFVRFVKVGDGGHLDTAITTYRKGDVEVVFFGAVHIADAACYATLNDRFTTCDVLLYELVGPADHRPSKDREQRGFSPISLLQQGLKNSLELAFQLDEIDYQAANFVHADMTPAEFEKSMEERGESLLSIMLNMMMNGMQLQAEKLESGEAPPPFDLVKAFRSGEGRHTLRMAFGQQLEEIEVLAAGGKGSTLLEGRNEKCLEVLQRELAAGRKKLGIYYGAAHLPHLEQRLVGDLGFAKTGHEWLVAWDCTKRPDAKFDRELWKARQRCRDELKALAAIAKRHREKAGGEPPTPAQLAAQPPGGGEPAYSGPVKDPWGNDYVLRKRPTGSRWEAFSAGPDGKPDTADDLAEIEPRRGGL